MPAFKLQNNGWLRGPWAEFIGKDGSHGGSFQSGWDGQNNAVLNILVNWDDVVSGQVQEDLLGSAFFDAFSDELQRTPPVQHPLFTDYRCEKILHAQPLKWTGKEMIELPYGAGAGGDRAAASKYQYFLLSLGFAKPPFTILTDTDLQAIGGGEWNRYVIVREEAHHEIITREAGQFIWDASAPQAGQIFNSPVGQRIYSSILTVTWVRVPRVGLFANGGDSDFLVSNIRDNVDKVHDGTVPFWPEVKGNANGSTLRLMGSPHVEPMASPLFPAQVGQSWKKPNYFYTVTFKFHLWEPPSGDNVNFGHNLAPSPALDGKWYLVKTASGATINPVDDLTQVFQLELDLA